MSTRREVNRGIIFLIDYRKLQNHKFTKMQLASNLYDHIQLASNIPQ